MASIVLICGDGGLYFPSTLSPSPGMQKNSVEFLQIPAPLSYFNGFVPLSFNIIFKP